MDSVLSSTFFLTLLLLVGLFFFIRASTKDRTEVADFITDLDEVTLLEQLKQYFERRAYQVTHIDPEQSRIELAGFVQASRFLAVFLSLLAAIGLSCVALVIGLSLPTLTWQSFTLVLLSPLAGIFYWRGARRTESVSFQLQAIAEDPATGTHHTRLQVSAHRDELISLRQALPLERVDA